MAVAPAASRPGTARPTGSRRSRSWAVESRGVKLLLDPLLPPPSAREAWERIDAFAPDAVVVLKPDHVRDVDLIVRWYGARAFGPLLFWRDDIPQTELEPLRPGDELPGGLLALDDGRGMLETPLYLPEQRALVFADGMTAPGGELRVWALRAAREAHAAGAARAAGAGRSSTCSSPTANPSTRARTSWPRSNASHIHNPRDEFSSTVVVTPA